MGIICFFFFLTGRHNDVAAITAHSGGRAKGNKRKKKMREKKKIANIEFDLELARAGTQVAHFVVLQVKRQSAHLLIVYKYIHIYKRVYICTISRSFLSLSCT